MTMAEIAFYSVPRAGGTVSGPSIRLAEECARTYGNFEYGHRELSRDSEKSEVEVYAWDKEKNNFSRRQITVFHIRDTKNGPQRLRDQKDIDDKIANVASKQVRSRILALLPKWLVQAAENKCRETLSTGGQVTVRDRVLRMAAAFARFSVTVKHLETIIGHSLDDITPDEIADLQGVFNAIKEGAKIGDFFPESDNDEAAATLTQQAKQTVAEQKAKPVDAEAKPDLTPKNTRKKQEKPADPVPEAKAETVVKTDATTADEPQKVDEPKPEVVRLQADPVVAQQLTEQAAPDPDPEHHYEPEQNESFFDGGEGIPHYEDEHAGAQPDDVF